MNIFTIFLSWLLTFIPVHATDNLIFPTCTELQPPGNHATYDEGWHQIVGDGLLYGSDNVYSLGNGNFVQCFCPPEGDGIQTDWLKTPEPIEGWINGVNGNQWNLGEYTYAARNTNYKCNEVTPTPEVTTTPAPTQPPQDKPISDSPRIGSYEGKVCTGSLNAKPSLKFDEVVRPGCAQFTMEPNTDQYTHANFYYGYEPDELTFSHPNLPKESRTFTICSLDIGSGRHVWGKVCIEDQYACNACSDIIDP